MPKPTRRRFLRQLGAGLSAASALPAACPTVAGPVRWIVPHAVGGGYDSFSRLLEPFLEKTLGAGVQIDNMPGAGGLRGATALSQARADGTTLGILNLPGTLMASLTGFSNINPLDSLTLLGTMARSRHVWSTGADSGFESVDRMLEAGRNRGLVFAINSFSSLGFLTAAIPCALLGLRAEFVSGYKGSQDSMMAAIRGEVDLVSLSWDSQLDRARGGDLRPLFRIAGDQPAEHELYAALPALAGSRGLAAERGPSALADGEALVRFSGAGRVVAAPPGLAPDLERCLAEAVCAALRNPAAAAAASRAGLPWEPSCAKQTVDDANAVRADVQRLEPMVRAAMAGVGV